MSKDKKLSEDARTRTISLTAKTELALQAIESLRRWRGDTRDTRNEIIEDAIWQLLEVENVQREQIEGIFPPKLQQGSKSNIKKFPNKDNKTDS